MRGEQRRSEGLFSYIRLEERFALDHPLRAILVLVNKVLGTLSARFNEIDSHLYLLNPCLQPHPYTQAAGGLSMNPRPPRSPRA
ncbi:putative transposase [Bradyrhizobium sp. BTAi1]|nr:putative transposase [Bradyrhizobium sp. BTAi1]